MDYVITRTDPNNGSFIIKPYTFNGPAAPNTVALYPGAVSANTTLILPGKGDPNYGEPIAKDLVHLLENFAGPISPSYPIQGQLWFNNSVSSLSVYDGANWYNLVTSGNMTIPFDLNHNKLINLGNATNGSDALNLQTAEALFLPLTGGTVNGTITIFGGTVTGLNSPSLPSDAATKAYVDSNAGVVSFNTRTGIITLNSTDISNALGYVAYSSANPAGYLTQAAGDSRYIPSGGGTVSGTFTFTSGTVTGLAPPISNTDAATKAYVDALVLGGGGGVSSFNTRVGAVTLLSSDVSTALGYTPYDSANPAGYLTASTLTVGDITTALGFTPQPPDGTVSGGSVNGTNLVLSLTVGSPVTISGIAPAVHHHTTADIHVNANSPAYDTSRIRDIFYTSPAFPDVSFSDVLAYVDQDLFTLMGKKIRTIFSVDPGYAVVAVTTGVNGTWTIAGNHTAIFQPGYVVKVDGNSDGASNITYTVVSSTFSTPNTIITVTSIPATATVTGTVRPLTYELDIDAEYNVAYNTLYVTNNGVKLYASQHGTSYTLIPQITSGFWCGLYNGTYNFTIAIDGGSPVSVPITVAQPSYTINAVTQGVAGLGSFTITGNYANTIRANTKFLVLGNTGLGANAFFTGSISGSTLTVSAMTSGVIAVGDTIQSASTYPNTVITGQLTGTLGGVGTYSVDIPQTVTSQSMTTAHVYNVVTATDSGANTIITVDSTIGTTVAANGTLYEALLGVQLAKLVNTELSTLNIPAVFALHTSYFNIYSNTIGVSSQVTYTDGTFASTIAANLAVTATTVNKPAISTNYGYKEVGVPYSLSNLVELDSSIATGSIVECICTV